MLALFDDSVDHETKKKIVEKLFKSPHDTDNFDLSDDNQTRVPEKAQISRLDVPKLFEQGLEQFVNVDSIIFFHKLKISTTWLKKNYENWSEDADYQDCLEAVTSLTVVNDIAERGVKLMQEYNDLFTKDK